MSRPIYKWPPNEVDVALDKLMSELKRVPTYGEFIKKYPGGMDAIKSGRYNSQITSWTQYIKQKGLRNAKQRRISRNRDLSATNKWSPETIDAAFDQMKTELGRVPLYTEFKNKHGGALGAINDGRYNISISSYGDYLEHRGFRGKLLQWPPEKIDQAFDQMVVQLGRRPTYDEFYERAPTAMDSIFKGRYNPDITSWTQYLAHRNFIPIKDVPSFRELIKTDETAQMFVRVLGGSPAALGRALSIKYQGRLVAEDVPDYLPSLGPYLGTITVSPPPPGPGGFEGVLIELPLEAILEDQLLRDTFLNMGREYYFSLIESEHPTEEDRQTLVGIIKANAEEAEHPSLKWLHQTLFDEFSRFHELARELAEIKAKINGDN